MLFPTIEFIVFFIAVITALVCYKNRKFQHVLLVVASFFFLYFSDNYLIMLLIYTTILHYFIGKKIFIVIIFQINTQTAYNINPGIFTYYINIRFRY